MTISDESVSELLNALHLSLEPVKAHWKELELTKAPRFRSFAFFSKREEAVSKMVAALLDPAGTHGQGRLFWDLFLARISDGNLNHLSEKEVRSIVVEDRTTLQTRQRRIDIVVYFSDGFQLGIENKIFGAKEQPDQIDDYRDELNRRTTGKFTLLLLHPDGAPRNMEETNTLIQEPAKRFLSLWIEECKDHCKAETVREFLRRFREYIEHPPEETFMDTDRTKQLVTTEILKSTETIEAAFAVYAHIGSAKEVVLNGLLNKAYLKLEEQLNQSALELSEWTMSRSRIRWPADKRQQPIIEPHPSPFQEWFDINEWRYIGIECNSPVMISVELELGFYAPSKGSTERLGAFDATVGLHKTGQYECQESKWIRSNKLSEDQETKVQEALKTFRGVSYSVIEKNSATAEDWNWSRSLDSSLRELDDEAIQKLFRAWKEDTDVFVSQLIEGMVDLAKKAQRALVSSRDKLSESRELITDDL